VVVAVIEVLHIAAALYLLFTKWGSYGWNSLAQILVAGIVLFLLFNPRADEFFRQRHSA
jgi:hypothetical protein